ncbi:MAG: glycosyltransferase family 39 protein, partial [Pyrinomonadaceae bacterium]
MLDFVLKKWTLILPCLIAVTFSLFTISYFGWGKIDFGDTQDYINGANAFLNHTPYPLRSIVHPMFRPPLFSYLISWVWVFFPQSVVAVKLMQCLFHAATVFIAYKTIYEVLRKKVPAFFGASVVAINPLLAAHTIDFYTEPLHTFLCILAMYLLLKCLQTEKHLFPRALVTGIIFGLATLTRP